ncbi:MAG TPA: enoyl-CoA hydratase/isomerase family protein [Myxococcales bacterium]
MRVERSGEVAVLRLENGKANSISPSFLERLDGLLAGIGDARAAVMIGQGSAFSAGLDLPALVDLDRPAMRSFILRFDEAMLRLFELPVPLVAAVNGHAVAGGCVLALQADVRIGADRDARIGLNETRLGIGLPAVVLETLRAQVPGPSLAVLALEGRLVPPREALQLGVLHEVVPEADLLPRAVARAAALAALPPAGVRMVKASLRRPAAAAARAAEESEAERWLDTWFAEESRGRLREAVGRLRKG